MDFEWKSRADISLYKDFRSMFAASACGPYIYDSANYKWLDLTSSSGEMVFGYGCPQIQAETASLAMKGGFPSAFKSRQEIIAAEAVKKLFPFVDKVRFFSDPSAAFSALENKTRTSFLGTRKGFLKAGGEFDLEQVNGRHSAVVVKPVVSSMNENRLQWLKELRARCHETGTFLVFDELDCCLRLPDGSASNAYGLIPDYAVMGSQLANGERVFTVVSSRDCDLAMNCWSGSPSPLQLKAVETVCSMARNSGRFDFKRLASDSEIFFQSLNNMADGLFEVEYCGSMGTIKGKWIEFGRRMHDARIYFEKEIYINFALLEHLDDVLKYAQMVIDGIQNDAKES